MVIRYSILIAAFAFISFLFMSCGIKNYGSPDEMKHIESYNNKSQLQALYLEKQIPLVVINGHVYEPGLNCLLPRKDGNADENRKNGKNNNNRKNGEAEEIRNSGANNNDRKNGNADEKRNNGNADEIRNSGTSNNNRKNGNADEKRNKGNVDEIRNSGTSNNNRKDGKAQEKRKAGDAIQHYTCKCMKSKKEAGFQIYGIRKSSAIFQYNGRINTIKKGFVRF